MLPTYEAVLQGGRIEWTGDAPQPLPPDQRIRVLVTWLDVPAAVPDPERGRRMAAALERLAASGVHEKFGDPLVWQREERRDRPLPGRDE
jgi:hypothetical protein